jgi:hypothetical protein
VDRFFASMASEVATMQHNWQENRKEGAAGWHDYEARSYSSKMMPGL